MKPRQDASINLTTGSVLAVRGETEFMMAQVVSLDAVRDIIHIRWYGEIKDFPRHYTLLEKWEDSVSPGAVITSNIQLQYNSRTGLYLLSEKDVQLIQRIDSTM